MPITFFAKNLSGQILNITYNKAEEIPNILVETFGKEPLYSPVWLDEDGYENFPPRNQETVFVLYRYTDIKVIFVNDWACSEFNTNKSYTEYSLIIESKSMEDLYEEIVISFFKEDNNNIFYSELEFSKIRILHEDRGSQYKVIQIGENAIYNTSIKDIFMSFRHIYTHIPEDFFRHLADCAENSWRLV